MYAKGKKKHSRMAVPVWDCFRLSADGEFSLCIKELSFLHVGDEADLCVDCGDDCTVDLTDDLGCRGSNVNVCLCTEGFYD